VIGGPQNVEINEHVKFMATRPARAITEHQSPRNLRAGPAAKHGQGLVSCPSEVNSPDFRRRLPEAKRKGRV